MFQKRSAGNLSLLVLLVLLCAALAACNPGSSPTATPLTEPTATTEAPTAPTDTALPPTQPPTETVAPPTDTAAPPTQAAAETPTLAPVADLAWRQVGLVGKAVQSIAGLPSGGSIVVATGPDGAWRSAYDFTQWEQ